MAGRGVGQGGLRRGAHRTAGRGRRRGGGAALRAFIARVGEALARAEEDDALLDDVPEDFADPILCTLMRDPVRAGTGPGARVYDRASITQQLLNNPVDPFTRAPLKASDLVPDDELRARIEAWVAGKRAGAGAGAGAGGK